MFWAALCCSAALLSPAWGLTTSVAPGKVLCWGFDDASTNAARQLEVPGGLYDVVGLAVGSQHSCSLSSIGAVRCWGDSSKGATAVPVGLPPMVAVTAGEDHTCALGEAPILVGEGDVTCWGFNTAAFPPSNITAVAVSAGGSVTCTVDTVGTMRCYGGDGVSGNEVVPGNLGPVTLMQAGPKHTCALAATGVKCWGKNDDGRCTVPADLGTAVTALSLSNTHSCAIASGGTLRCWGSAAVSQGATTVPAGLGAVTLVMAGDGYTCALKAATGGVVCFGRNNATDALEIAALLGEDAALAPSGSVHGCAAVASVAGGKCANGTLCDATAICVDDAGAPGGYQCVCKEPDHQWNNVTCIEDERPVYCFGFNPDFNAAYDSLAVPYGLGDVQDVAVGAQHSCALTAAGAITCWGSDEDGQSTPPANLPPAKAIAAAGSRSCAVVKATGAVVCWGLADPLVSVPSNVTGVEQVMLGQDCICTLDAAKKVACYGQPGTEAPPGLGAVQALGVGFTYVCAANATGVKCWGACPLGDCSVPAGVGAGVSALSLGDDHACALTGAGALTCWGFNAFGQCDVPADLAPVRAVSAGIYYTCAVSALDGEMTCFGNGTAAAATAPFQSAAMGRALELSANSGHHTCGVRENVCKEQPGLCGSEAACTTSPADPLGYTCVCTTPGYAWNGTACSDIDECQPATAFSVTCDINAECTNTPGGYTCACLAGFVGDGFNCTDVDECKAFPCNANATCDNTPGGFNCTCKPGFEGDGLLNCTAGSGGTGTNGTATNCSSNASICGAHATCAATGVCACLGGYSGDGLNCTDIDECKAFPCNANATCANTPGGFNCTCKPGFDGDGLNCTAPVPGAGQCQDNATNACGANAICASAPLGNQCACLPGFTGDGLVCTDVDECAASTPPCHANATCANTPGGFNCTCKPGFDGDGLICTGFCVSNGDCASSKYGPVCSKAEGRCRACVISDDCLPLTAPFCSIADNACKPCVDDTQCTGSLGGPFCVAGGCVQCNQDADCSAIAKCNTTTHQCFNVYVDLDITKVQFDLALQTGATLDAYNRTTRVELTLADNVTTTLDASGISCSLDACTKVWTVTCTGRDPVQIATGNVANVSVGKGAGFFIDTTGLPATSTCVLTLTVSGAIPTGSSNSTNTSAAGDAALRFGALAAPGDVVNASLEFDLLVNTVLQPPRCEGRVPNVTLIQSTAAESKYCTPAAANKTSDPVFKNVTAGVVTVGVATFADPQGTGVSFSVTRITMNEPLATPCKKCTGPKTARSCRCTPSATVNDDGTVSILPVSTGGAKKAGVGRLYTISWKATTTGGSCEGSFTVCAGTPPKGGGPVTCAQKVSPKCIATTKKPNQKCDPTVCSG